MMSVAREDGQALLGEAAEPAVGPDGDDDRAADQARQDDDPAQQQPVLEPEAAAHAVEPRVVVAHEVHAVGVGAEPERDDLRPDDEQQRAGDHRVQVPRAAEDVDLARAPSARRARRAPPARRPGTRKRCVGLWTSRKRRWRQPSRKVESFDSPPRGWYSIGNSAIVELLLGGADDHLRGELHARWCAGRASAARRAARPRMPQWASRTPVRKKRLRMPERIGLPT